MITEESFYTLNSYLIDGKYRFFDSKRGLDATIKASILYYIQQNPQLTLFQVFHILRNLLNDNADTLELYLKNAYPRANPKIQKRIDINKLFSKPIKTN